MGETGILLPLAIEPAGRTRMPFTIAHWSRPHLTTPGSAPYLAVMGIVHKDTASEAWVEVQCLMASDETVEITSPSGAPMRWQELKALAEREAH